MAILGGDDAGGGVIWAPQVITDAKDHGLVLGENGKLYDSKKGQSLPEGVKPMPLLTDDELEAFPEPTALDVVPGYVARYWDLMALAAKQPAKVIGADAILKDRPGFEVELLTRGSIPEEPYATDPPRGADGDARPLAALVGRRRGRSSPPATPAPCPPACRARSSRR
jgi:hypothetical protein